MAGVENKDKGFWKGLEKWDVIFLCETWLQEKSWERVKNRLPKGYDWINKGAEKRNKKGRAMGGMLLGWKKELEGVREDNFEERKGIIGVKIKCGGSRWKIGGVYINGNMDNVMEVLRMWMEEKEEGYKYVIGGDFNVRTGRGGLWEESEEEEGEERRRNSKDEKITGEGKKLCKILGEMGWGIVNGCIKGDEEGELTYTGGRGNTIIDYVISEVESKGGYWK